MNRRLEALAAKYLRTEEWLPSVECAGTKVRAWEYYTDANLQLVHVFSTIPEFQLAPHRIAQALGVPEEEVHRALVKLKEMGLASYQNGVYRAADVSLHLAENSPAYKAYRLILRLRAIERMQSVVENEGYFFSCLFSASEAFSPRMRSRLLRLLAETQAEVAKETGEAVFQLNIDLVNWSGRGRA